MRLLFCVVLLFVLPACNQQEWLQKVATPADQELAKSYIERLRNREFDEIEKAFDTGIRSGNVRETLEKMANLIPAGEPTSVQLVGAQRFEARDATTLNTTFEYDFDGKWLLINVALKTKGDARTIVGFHVNPEDQSLEVRNRFTPASASPAGYAILVLGAAAALITLCALVICIRTSIPRRKWLWIVFIVLGIGRFSVNWATGEWNFAPFYVQLLSLSAFAAFNGPWIVSASLPVGALVFLARRKKLPAL